MTSEFLLQSIGQIDDALVMEAAALPARRAPRLTRYAALAAAAVLCVGLAALPRLAGTAGLMGRKGASTPAAAQDTEPPMASAGSMNAPAESHAPTDTKNPPQTSAASQFDPQAPAAAASVDSSSRGADAALLYTEKGVYAVTEEAAERLPDGSVPLGQLSGPVLAEAAQLPKSGAASGAASAEPALPATSAQEYVGCAVWESGDGSLFIRLADGRYRKAVLVPEP